MLPTRYRGIALACKTHHRGISALRPAFAIRTFNDAAKPKNSNEIDLEKLLSTPTWSVASLLQPEAGDNTIPEITSAQLHHLLRLSALPPPASPDEEASMLATLSAQLHFVRDIQNVDTTGVEPLRSLHDETAEGKKQAEIGLQTQEIQEALANEEVVGKHHKRLRRRRDIETQAQAEAKQAQWDVLSTASKTTGRYFVVERDRSGQSGDKAAQESVG